MSHPRNISRKTTENQRSQSRHPARRQLQLESLEDRTLLSATLFADSFEDGQWNGQWVEDSQNDWNVSTQRAIDGSHAAEVDGSASNAMLSLANPLDLTGYESAELTFSWYIESSWDSGEYIAVDLYDGSGWTEVAALRGNVDQENVWHSETVAIDGNYLVSDFQVRFRAKVSSSTEDGFVDNVKIVGTVAGPPEISISDAAAQEAGAAWGFVDTIALDSEGITGWSRDVAKGSNGDLYVIYNQVIDGESGLARIEKIDGDTGEVDHDFIPLGTAGLFQAKEIEIHDGWIYVSNKGTDEILRFDESTGTPDSAGAFVSSGAGGLTTPRGMLFDAAGDLLVGSKGTDEILKFSGTDGTFMSVFASNVTDGGTGPKGIILDAAGDLYAAGNESIYKYDGIDGTFLGLFVSSGLTDAAGLVFGPEGDLYVGNYSAFQILQFDGQTGDIVATIDIDPAHGNPLGLAFDNAGSFYIATNLTVGDIVRYAPSSSAVFTVSLSSPSAIRVTVEFNTTDITATAGSDYTATSGVITFAPGETSRTIIVPTLNDTDAEGDETFTVTLSNPVGTTIADGAGLGTIVDDEIPNLPPLADIGGPYVLGNRAMIQLDASGSHDVDQPADTLTYQWDFDNDGNYDDAVGVRPYFTAADLNGKSNAIVHVKVVDDEGAYRTGVVRVYGEDTSVLRIRGDNDGVVGQRRVISLKLYGPTVTHEKYSYTVDWGDGSQPRVVSGISGLSISKRYNKPGNYTIRATAVSDETGLETTHSRVIHIGTVQQQGRDFAVSGTSGDDYFRIFTRSGHGQVEIYRNRVSLGVHTVPGTIYAFGLGGDDWFVGDNGTYNVYFDGGSGNNVSYTYGGDDTILGRDGRDRVYNYGGDNYVSVGNGNNLIKTNVGDDYIVSGRGSDTIIDTGGDNHIYAGDGNNDISTRYGNDIIITGSGRDQITDLGGNNHIEAGDGSNVVRTGTGNDTILGGAQADNIRDEGGRNYIYTFAGNDYIIAFGTNYIDSGPGDDFVFSQLNLLYDDSDLFDLLARAR